jgi:hypothetical protein
LQPHQYRHLQTVSRPVTDREGARHCGPVYEPARSRPGIVRG